MARIHPLKLYGVAYRSNTNTPLDPSTPAPSAVVALTLRMTIKWARDHGLVAVGIMPMLIQECQIIDAAFVGKYPTYRIWRATGLPFPLNWTRDKGMWGLILGFDSISGTISTAGISFQTQGEGKGVLQLPLSLLGLFLTDVLQVVRLLTVPPPSPNLLLRWQFHDLQ